MKVLRMPWHTHGDWRDWRDCVLYLLSLALLLVALAACSGSPTPPPPLSVLHLPGVVQLDAVANLETKTGDHGIYSTVVYRPTDATTIGETSATHILYAGNRGLADLRLDGTGLRQIQMQPPCLAEGVIAVYGAHGVCFAENSRGVLAFEADALSSSWTSHVLVPTSPASFEALLSPTIAPDGKHFAALHRIGSEPIPTINIYTVDSSFTGASLVATITLLGFYARRLVWSPDGRWLAFTTDESTETTVAGATYAFRLASVLPALPTIPVRQRQPIQVAVSKAHLTQLLDGTDMTDAWYPTGASAVWTYAAGRTIWQVDVLTGKRSAILTIPDGDICAFAWTPDGKQVVFVQCRLAGSMVVPPPARLYVYTLPTT